MESRSMLAERRRFLLQAATGLGMLAAAAVWPTSSSAQEDDPVKASKGGPAEPSWRIVMVKEGEAGEPLVIAGTIFAADGKTPVEGARLYVYHTDASGRYTRNFLRRRPRLRGWMKTGADGRYEFRTIRPGAYPGERIPAHIHATLSAPGHSEKWIEDFLFIGDPNVPAEVISRAQQQGTFSNLLRLTRGADGIWRGVRDIRLP